MKLRFLFIFLILFVCGLLLWFTAIFRLPLEKRKMNISGKELTVWVVDSEVKRLQGLQNIIWMPKDRGMLFVFNAPDRYCFWNKNTFIPLNLIFMRGEKIVNEIYLKPIWQGKQTVCPVEPADAVLEINAY
ncbi:MAG: DUF192 domain-containing protein [Candidatus Omnitrophota bacterium]